MKNSVIIKGNKFGFQIVLDPSLSFDELLHEVALKFKESARFFQFPDAIAVSFDGRRLTGTEQNAILETIQDNTGLCIGYVMNAAKDLEFDFHRGLREQNDQAARKQQATSKAVTRHFPSEASERNNQKDRPASSGTASQPEAVVRKSEAPNAFTAGITDIIPTNHVAKDGQFYRGTLRSGQRIEVDGSIVIMGDINPGAQVIAGGNVVVLGALKGIVSAGVPQDKKAFVVALHMDPMQIQIGPCIARSPDQKEKKQKRFAKKTKQPEFEAKIAFVEDDNIFIETITRSLLNEISLG